jgi:hypothetical protein
MQKYSSRQTLEAQFFDFAFETQIAIKKIFLNLN